MSRSIAVAITDDTGVGEARRSAAQCAELTRLNPSDRGKAALVATELAKNLAKYAPGGHIIFRSLDEVGGGGLEVLSVDKGPGIADIGQSLSDGFSSRGTPGTGLGAVRRLSAVFDIYSVPGQGTVICARIQNQAPAVIERLLDVGAVCLPMHGQTQCGDAWSADTSGTDAVLMIVDGLGHGPAAAGAADEAVRMFAEHPGGSPAEIVEASHGALKPTCGAVIGVARIDFGAGAAQYVGVGNIGGAIVGYDSVKHMVSMNGTVGAAIRSIRAFSYDWQRDACLVMHSDGLVSHWDLAKYPGLLSKHPAIIAGVLHRDFNRGRDDVTVIVAKAGKK